MATTDNAADVKKICNSTVNLIDDNPLGSRFSVPFDDAKGSRRVGAEAHVTWAPTLRTDEAPNAYSSKTKTGRAHPATLPAPSSISTSPYSTKLSRNAR